MGWQIINGIPYRQGGGSSWSSSRFASAAKIVVDSDSQLTLSW